MKRTARLAGSRKIVALSLLIGTKRHCGGIIIRMLLAFASVYCLTALSRAQDVDGMVFCKDVECSKNTHVAWTKVVKDLNNNLQNAQQVNTYVGTCRSGAFINAATNFKFPFVLGTAVKTTDGDAVEGYSSADQNPPGRYKGSDGDFYYSYPMYLSKSATSATVPTAKSIHTDAAGWVGQDPKLKDVNHPQYATGNKANEALALNGGTNATWDLMFTGDTDGLTTQLRLEFWKAINGLKPTNFQFYWFNYPAQTTSSGVVISGPGTYDNWGTALGTLKAQADKAVQKTLVNIFLDGHGFHGKADLALAPGGVPGLPGQGTVVGQGMGETTVLNIPTDADFWNDMSAGIVDPGSPFVRGEQPTFFFAASAASVTMPVTVSIGPFVLGSFMLPSTPGGGEIEIPLTDSTIQSILGAYGGSSSLNLSFSIAPSDWIRVGLEADLIQDPSYQPLLYGAGIMTSVFVENPPSGGTASVP